MSVGQLIVKKRVCPSVKIVHIAPVPDRDLNEEASRQVNEVTGSPPVNGEDLIESEDLKRQLREAKQRLADDDARPPNAPVL